jgi:hypothetical protein
MNPCIRPCIRPIGLLLCCAIGAGAQARPHEQRLVDDPARVTREVVGGVLETLGRALQNEPGRRAAPAPVEAGAEPVAPAGITWPPPPAPAAGVTRSRPAAAPAPQPQATPTAGVTRPVTTVARSASGTPAGAPRDNGSQF